MTRFALWARAPKNTAGWPPGALAQSTNLVNRASSPNTFAGHGPLARSVFWCSGPGLRLVSRASSPNTLAGQTPPLVTKLRRHFSEELFLTWALLGFAPQCSGPGVNSSLCEEWEGLAGLGGKADSSTTIQRDAEERGAVGGRDHFAGRHVGNLCSSWNKDYCRFGQRCRYEHRCSRKLQDGTICESSLHTEKNHGTMGHYLNKVLSGTMNHGNW